MSYWDNWKAPCQCTSSFTCGVCLNATAYFFTPSYHPEPFLAACKARSEEEEKRSRKT